jgi:chloride channel protein, CIC family
MRTKLINKYASRLSNWRSNESLVLSTAAVLVGISSGVGIWVFKQLIDLFHTLSFTNLYGLLSPLGRWPIALIPIIGGLVVGLIVHFAVGVERHHGVAGIMEAVALAGGRLRYKRIPAKALVSAISIGTGASVGPEDPSVQIGANLGSFLGQSLRMSDERVRALVAAGAAAGIAAAFNAPIAGVFFALEIILGEIAGSAFWVVVVASVSSAVVTQALSGAQPAFRVPAYAFKTALELPFYLVLGLLAGPVAAVYIRLLYRAQDILHHWSLPRWIKPAVAGIAVGVTGIFLPQLFGVGYETIETILAGGKMAIWLLLLLLVGKILLTPLSIAGGFMGGVFAPALFLGATLGAAYGYLAEMLFPNLPLNPAAFAMVGMAAVLAGAVHSPLTAIILLFEMTNDYRIILPLMFAVAISLYISQRLQADSVYTLGLARHGIRLERGKDIEVLEALTVGEVMQTEMMTFKASDTLISAADTLFKTRHHGLPVIDHAGDLMGILTIQDIDRAKDMHQDRITVGEACTKDLLVAYPDESIGNALRKMGARDIGRLPVVSRENEKELVGLLRRSDMVRAYDIALTRRAALRHRAHQVRLGAISDERMDVTEMIVEAGAPCAGKHISETQWPRGCVLASLRRGRRVLIPHGDTLVKAGDVLVIVAEGHDQDEINRLCRASIPQSQRALE